MKRLTKKQMKIAKVAPPRNKITKADFDILNKNSEMGSPSGRSLFSRKFSASV